MLTTARTSGFSPSAATCWQLAAADQIEFAFLQMLVGINAALAALDAELPADDVQPGAIIC